MKNKSPAAVRRIITILDEHYPWDGRCFLEYDTPWQLLFATVLSAQCTDERVNQVTKKLFARYLTLEDFAAAEIAELEEIVRPAGFFRVKARNIRACANDLHTNHSGEVPSDIDALTKLPGVGRKTANVVRSHVFSLPSVTVDTHVGRVSRRLGLTAHTDAVKIEYDLMRILPEETWIRMNAQMILHGRRVCKARKPLCRDCPLAQVCEGI